MIGFGRTELGLTFLIAMFAIWLGLGTGYRFFLQPALSRAEDMREEMAKIRIDKARIRKTRAQVTRFQSKLKAMEKLFEDLRIHLVRSENDRFRMDLARDKAMRGLEDLTLTPVDIRSPPLKLSFDNPIDPNVQLQQLKEAYLKKNPRGTLPPRWEVPTATTVLRYVEKFSLEGSVEDLTRFLGRIECDELHLEVTSVKIGPAIKEEGKPDRVTAMVEISALGFPPFLEES